jgi:serine/threonine protein kinase
MSEPNQRDDDVLDRTQDATTQSGQTADALLAADSSPEVPATPSGPTGTVLVDKDATIGSSETTVGFPSEEAPGDLIGRYKLLEIIGEGGFGLVYVAEQTEPVKRRVALKVIKLGMDTRQVVARFEAERQALALMDHPNIAKVLDAGSTENGRPYFVMEYVNGTKITEYCDRNKLSTRKRLDLFMSVCRAIEHAHQKGIIHRDIKPSNILVTISDGAPTPKVIDFGIAKATQGNLTEKAVHTMADQFIGTPAYMSPEQAEAGGMDIDTRTDIYSLGVLLYELLTGETPLESKNLLSRGFDEMRRLIREWEPQLPSIVLHKQKSDEQTTTAKRHGTEAPKLIKMVRGDLDWVVMKCLEKDRNRRYDSAALLNSDIERFLNNEPVSARPPSNFYRFQKLVRRNRLAFAAGSAIFASLVIALFITSWFVVKEKQERDMAEQASKNSDNARRIAEEALAQAEQARQQSDIDLKHTEAARQQSNLDRARADMAEETATDAQKTADAARAQAAAAAQQARQDSAQAAAAEKRASDAQAAAQTARQLAKAADDRAKAESAKAEEAIATAASEKTLREQAESARADADIARQKAEAAASNASVQIGQWQQSISNMLDRLSLVQQPAAAQQFANFFFTKDDDTQPWAARYYKMRGEWEGRQGDWQHAGKDFTKAAKLEPDVFTSYNALAPLFIKAELDAGYSYNCRQILDRFGGTNADPVLARQIALDCLFAPAQDVDLTPVAELAKKSQSPLVMALAEYRQGHYAEAADLANKSLTNSGEDSFGQAEAAATLAMAQQQLKQPDNAKISLTKCEQIVVTQLPKLESGDLGPGWGQWLMAKALKKEASTLIDGKPDLP